MLDLMTTTHGSYLDIWKKDGPGVWTWPNIQHRFCGNGWTRSQDMAKYPRPFSLKWMDKESVDGIPKTVFVETDRPEVRKWNTQDRFCGNGWTRSQLMEYPGSFLWRRIDQEMEHSRSFLWKRINEIGTHQT